MLFRDAYLVLRQLPYHRTLLFKVPVDFGINIFNLDISTMHEILDLCFSSDGLLGELPDVIMKRLIAPYTDLAVVFGFSDLSYLGVSKSF